MNFFEALTAAVNDGKKIRQTDWTEGVYVTADETGQLTRHKNNRVWDTNERTVNAGYCSLASANWEFYTKSCRFKDVAEGETFTVNSYHGHQYTKIKETFGINAIRSDQTAVYIDKDKCVTVK